MKLKSLAAIGNWQASPHLPNPSNPPVINSNHIQTIKIHVLAAISNKQASPRHPKPSNPPEITEHQRKVIKIHVCHQFAMCMPPPRPSYFAKPLGAVPNTIYDANQYAKKRSAA